MQFACFRISGTLPINPCSMLNASCQVPAQTAAHENHLLIAQQQQLQQLIDAQTIQHRVQQQEIEAARHFGRL